MEAFILSKVKRVILNIKYINRRFFKKFLEKLWTYIGIE